MLLVSWEEVLWFPKFSASTLRIAIFQKKIADCTNIVKNHQRDKHYSEFACKNTCIDTKFNTSVGLKPWRNRDLCDF